MVRVLLIVAIMALRPQAGHSAWPPGQEKTHLAGVRAGGHGTPLRSPSSAIPSPKALEIGREPDRPAAPRLVATLDLAWL